jgi:hypothetical protein
MPTNTTDNPSHTAPPGLAYSASTDFCSTSRRICRCIAVRFAWPFIESRRRPTRRRDGLGKVQAPFVGHCQQETERVCVKGNRGSTDGVSRLHVRADQVSADHRSKRVSPRSHRPPARARPLNVADFRMRFGGIEARVMGSQGTWKTSQPTAPTACDIFWAGGWSLI